MLFRNLFSFVQKALGTLFYQFSCFNTLVLKPSLAELKTLFFKITKSFSGFFKNRTFSAKSLLVWIRALFLYIFTTDASLLESRKALAKKYLYTINHKRLGLYYFYFAMWTGCSGALLATAIRLEMAYPGSPFFRGDSLKYLQVMTAHALIMIFFVVVPIFFGGFANFLIPYHVGSKDVAFPRLNSIGFWIQPCGYLLIAKIGFIRQQYWRTIDGPGTYFPMLRTEGHGFSVTKHPLSDKWDYRSLSYLRANPQLPELKLNRNFGLLPVESLTLESQLYFDYLDRSLSKWMGPHLFVKSKLLTPASSLSKNHYDFKPFYTKLAASYRLYFWNMVSAFPENFWHIASGAENVRRQKRHIVKCPNAGQTVAGWTFITPMSSRTKFTAYGVQDMLVVGIYFAGISTTISLTNLLVTRRTLSAPGLRNRRILLPFPSISILLMFRTLAVITPVLGSAMLMLMLDRHWRTTFFDFSYGGDPILFQHLFWFFGHPEVYVLIIPAFGIINVVIPHNNLRRVASKHHLIWAIYIMNYMGFLVWGHHMYLIGLDHKSRSLYSTITIMISLPATIKVVNWTYSLVNGALKVDAAFLASVSFILFFLVAGLTGMWLSHISLNVSMHDTMYVVAHFHLMLSGSVMLAIFAGFYYYFTPFFGIKYSRTWAYFHIVYYTGGQWLTFLPMFWLGFSGLPRRLHDFPAMYMGWQSMATAGHFVTMTGVLAFFLMLLDSHKEKKVGAPLNLSIPRLNKRALYYTHKLAYFHQISNVSKNLPTKSSRLFVLQNSSLNQEFERIVVIGA